MENIFTTLADQFQKGGDFMWPLVVVLVIGLAIALERVVFLVSARGRNRRFWKKIQPLLEQNDFAAAKEAANKSNSALASILTYGLDDMSSHASREHIETAMEEGLMEQMPRLEKRTHYLATLANIATLLGLLGTIMGMIGAFGAFNEAAVDMKTKILSDNIGIAMLTTAFGLMIAIPLLLIHSWLQSRTTELVDNLEMAVVKFLNMFKK